MFIMHMHMDIVEYSAATLHVLLLVHVVSPTLQLTSTNDNRQCLFIHCSLGVCVWHTLYACESECFAEDFSLLFVFSFSKWRPVASTHSTLRTKQNIRCVRCHYSNGFLQHTISSIPFFACSLNKRTKYEGHLVVLCAVVLNLKEKNSDRDGCRRRSYL